MESQKYVFFASTSKAQDISTLLDVLYPIAPNIDMEFGPNGFYAIGENNGILVQVKLAATNFDKWWISDEISGSITVEQLYNIFHGQPIKECCFCGFPGRTPGISPKFPLEIYVTDQNKDVLYFRSFCGQATTTLGLNYNNTQTHGCSYKTSDQDEIV